MERWIRLSLIASITFAAIPSTLVQAQVPLATRQGKPRAAIKDANYGPHERNIFDLWKANSDRPTPLVVYLHGGGFYRGRKESLSSNLLSDLLNHGVSVMAINYRLSPEATFPAHFMDGTRAIQFARTQTAAWNIDPRRIGCTGGSAGAGMAMWIAFHNDMADPKSDDSVLHQSTRLTCVAVTDAQTSYDPRVIKDWISEAAALHPMLPPFYGLAADELNSPRATAMYEAASPINLITSDDPPVYAHYSEDGPIAPSHSSSRGIHHVNFGLQLKKEMERLNIACSVRSRSGNHDVEQEIVAFFLEHLK